MQEFELTQPVCLVGFMGAGKSSLAGRLARMCMIPAVDMDALIEERSGRKIAEIFAESGEAQFRAYESGLLSELASAAPAVISCGGGVVLAAENQQILKSSTCVVYLDIGFEEAHKRISDLSTRPLFADIEKARELYLQRKPLYEQLADICIDSGTKSVNEIALELQEALLAKGVLCQRQK
ncbi:MAG: shikimate kinase [Eggerthellaceae bacterium]|nr:shikimate kinase [Eggerthellaceae bacterium]